MLREKNLSNVLSIRFTAEHAGIRKLVFTSNLYIRLLWIAKKKKTCEFCGFRAPIINKSATKTTERPRVSAMRFRSVRAYDISAKRSTVQPAIWPSSFEPENRYGRNGKTVHIPREGYLRMSTVTATGEQHSCLSTDTHITAVRPQITVRQNAARVACNHKNVSFLNLAVTNSSRISD